ncbi:hypothetical protein B296_00045402, partial [Ensete ventricosum]
VSHPSGRYVGHISGEDSQDVDPQTYEEAIMSLDSEKWEEDPGMGSSATSLGRSIAKRIQNSGYKRFNRPTWVINPLSATWKPGTSDFLTDLGSLATDNRWLPPCFQGTGGPIVTHRWYIRRNLRKVVPSTFRIPT